jgi:hypothetical protein
MVSSDKFRSAIITVLQLLSSKQRQLDFQKKSPSSNVALELLCLWFDDLYNPGSQLFNRSFSTTELELIQEFNRYYDLRKGKLPETIEELHQDSDWEIIMNEAQVLLTKINSN